MLDAVSRPVVVNPDPRMLAVALLRRWPVVHLDVPQGVPKLPVVGIEPQRALLSVAHPALFPFARFEISGMDNVPASGPRSEEHTSELQSLMRISYAVFCLKKKNKQKQ